MFVLVEDQLQIWAILAKVVQQNATSATRQQMSSRQLNATRAYEALQPNQTAKFHATSHETTDICRQPLRNFLGLPGT